MTCKRQGAVGMGKDVHISDSPHHFFCLVPYAKAASQETSSGMLELKVDFLKSAAQSITNKTRNDLRPGAVCRGLE